MALAEFQKAMMIDPASPIAQQETQNTLECDCGQERGGQSPAAGRSRSEAAQGDGRARRN